MNTIYNFITVLISGIVRLCSPLLNAKTRQWVDGRKNWRTRYRQQFQPGEKVYWMHVSSLGEFEQGRPVLELFRKNHPDWQIVLTFFSPSGYEMRKNYPLADFIAYLPVDTPANARDFIDLIRPSKAVFVKYDLWSNYLHELKRRKIHTILIAALFRSNHIFFKWYGGFWRRMVHCFDHIFTQTEGSKKLLESIGYQSVTVCGDPRVDRVLQIAAEAKTNDIVQRFSEGRFTIVAGSTWEKDELILEKALQHPKLSALKIIIAPHQPTTSHVEELCSKISLKTIRYSEAGSSIPLADFQCLVIDNVGMLNTLYRYGAIAYIGGGFGVGIHNTLEPAAFNLPVIFGPKYQKFEEAKQLISRGGAFSVQNAEHLQSILLQLTETGFREKASGAVRQYMEESKGASLAMSDKL